MSGGSSTALGIAVRQARRALASPPLWLPALLFPLLLFAAFAGGLSALGASPSFDYPDYTTFQFIYVVTVAAAMSGMLSGLALADDFETGFAPRMLLATRSRVPVVVGYVISALVRALAIGAVLCVIALIAGMEVSGNAIEVAAVIALTLFFSLVVSLWGIGFALRARSVKAAPALQTPVLVLMFLVPVWAPRPLLADEIQAIADWNPITANLEAARGLIIGEPVSVGLAFGLMAAFTALLVFWVLTGLRAAEAQGGLRG